jgi:hypothetical protein
MPEGRGLTEHGDLSGIDLIPTTERLLTDLLPEGAREEREPATAVLILDETLVPEVSEFADRDVAWKLPEHPGKQGRAVTARAGDA